MRTANTSPTDVAGPAWRGAVDRAVIGSVRITAGLLWLANLHWKVPSEFGADSGNGLYKYPASVTRHSPFAPFTWVTEEIILPNFRLFGWVTLLTELALALLLLIGYRVRWAALGGAIMSVPILLSTIFYDQADEWSWAYFMMIALHLILFATDAGEHIGLDGVLAAGDRARTARAVRITGVVAIVVGLLGLLVARNIGFAGDDVALLGSDGGFVNDADEIVRRWELKFIWFNPLWATLTVAFGAALLAGARHRVAGWVAASGFGVMAVTVMVVGPFDYLRDDGVVMVVGTGSNAAVWGGFAVAAVLLTRRLGVTNDAHATVASATV